MRYAAAVAAVGCLMTGEIEAGVIQVPGTAPSIQEAIEMANTGDEITVAAGTHSGPIDFMGKAIILRSEEGAAATFINGEGEGTVVTCENGEGPLTVLRGFTIEGGASLNGGGMLNQGTSPTVIDCIFSGNTAELGGGMYNTFAANPLLINTLFVGNVATGSGGGGGIHNVITSSPTVVNCTFAGNSAAQGGGIASFLGSAPTVTNCIIWGNQGSPAILDATGSASIVNHSNVEGGFEGAGNLDVDPQFIEPADHDFRLQSGSVCIDAGDNAAVPAEVSFDLDGLDRFVEDPNVPDTGEGSAPLVDLGAYERQVVPGDIDGDGVVDQADLLVVMEAWGNCPAPPDSCPADVNGDGEIDVNDLTALLLLWD